MSGDWRVTGAFSKLRAVYGKWAWLARRLLALGIAANIMEATSFHEDAVSDGRKDKDQVQ